MANGWGVNPFNRQGAGFDLKQQGGQGFAQATTAADPGAQERRAEESVLKATQVSFPPHLQVPYGAQTIDIRKVINVPPGTSVDILNFKGLPGGVVRFIAYGIFNDGLVDLDYRFLPLVNGQRVYPFHGDPDDNFRISLGLGPDLTNETMIEGMLTLNPTDSLFWRLTNNSLVNTAMGVRMRGYIDFTQTRVQESFGG